MIRIENINDVKLLINNYEFLEEKAETMITDEQFDEVEKVEWIDDYLIIYYSTYYKGCTEHLSTEVPIEWLFLSNDELEKEIEKKEKKEKAIALKQKKINEIIRKHAQEQKDREEYERLRAKFETNRK